MAYVWLTVAILCEVGWAVPMKLSQGFTRPLATAATVVMYLLSVVFLSFAAKRMDLAVAYSIWAGGGVSLIALVGMTWFREPVTALKIGSIALIALGIVGVQAAGGGEH